MRRHTVFYPADEPFSVDEMMEENINAILTGVHQVLPVRVRRSVGVTWGDNPWEEDSLSIRSVNVTQLVQYLMKRASYIGTVDLEQSRSRIHRRGEYLTGNTLTTNDLVDALKIRRKAESGNWGDPLDG